MERRNCIIIFYDSIQIKSVLYIYIINQNKKKKCNLFIFACDILLLIKNVHEEEEELGVKSRREFVSIHLIKTNRTNKRIVFFWTLIFFDQIYFYFA